MKKFMFEYQNNKNICSICYSEDAICCNFCPINSQHQLCYNCYNKYDKNYCPFRCNYK